MPGQLPSCLNCLHSSRVYILGQHQMQNNQVKWSKIRLLFPRNNSFLALVQWLIGLNVCFLQLGEQKKHHLYTILWPPSTNTDVRGEDRKVCHRKTEAGRGADASVWNFHEVLDCVRVCCWVREHVCADFEACMRMWGHHRASGHFNQDFVLQNNLIYNKCTAGNHATGHGECRWKIDWHTRLCKNTPCPPNDPICLQSERWHRRQQHRVGGSLTGAKATGHRLWDQFVD